MAKIYISSTFQDLTEERARAAAQLRKHRHEILSMEDYNASTRPPLEKCLADVAQSDIYLGLIAWRYGYVPSEDNPQNQSITEREYRHAVEKGKEIIILMVEADDWPLSKTDAHTGENQSGARIRAFRNHLNTAHVKGIFSTPDNLAAALSPAIEEAIENLNPVSAAQLDDIASLTRDQLELLASRFEIPAPHDRFDAELADILTKKAEEYRAYRAEIEAIDERTRGLGNLKAAAQDAANNLNFEEVEDLMSRVHEVELEVASETAKIRARNALLRGRSGQAYRIICAAADSFGAIDPLEPVRRKILEYAEFLARLGMRFGGDGLVLSVDLMQDVATDQLCLTQPSLWAAAQNALGIALQNQGIRAAGDQGTELLAGAVTAFGAALSIRTKDAHPLDWAMTQNNLGITLRNQGSRTAGEPGTELLARAITAFEAALSIYTKDAYPLDWARTQNNLGTALQEQAAHTAGELGTKLRARAENAFDAVLSIYTKDAYPLEWAGAQNNLGIALQEQGIRTAGEPGTALLACAVTAYEAALTIRTESAHPLDWAITRKNAAIAELELANHDATTSPDQHLQSALQHVDAALSVFDPDHTSYEHGSATDLREDILSRLS